MPWIKTIAPEEADGELKALYEAIGSARGGVADVHRAQSLSPRAMRAHLELYKAVPWQQPRALEAGCRFDYESPEHRS